MLEFHPHAIRWLYSRSTWSADSGSHGTSTTLDDIGRSGWGDLESGTVDMVGNLCKEIVNGCWGWGWVYGGGGGGGGESLLSTY